MSFAPCLGAFNGNPNLASDELTQRYDVTGVVLGVGKHSVVVQVRSKLDGQNYACKIISLATSGTDAKVEKEIRAMAAFKHEFSSEMVDHLRCSQQLPNVKSAPPYSCIVMKQIDGEPLTALIFQSGANPSLAWKMVYQIASVLREMHTRQLAHRDIWSENIMLGRNGNFYLIDFGCAESCVCPSAIAKNESLNLPYLSPQICIKRPPSCGDDMWALGLVLTELVTGKHIIRRMGTNEAPFFTKEQLFQAALDETAAIGGPHMGKIVRNLLADRESERATASDVLAMIPGQQMTNAMIPGQQMTNAMTPGQQMTNAMTPGQQPQISPTPSFTPPYAPAPEFYAGQKIQYSAKTHNTCYQAVMIGRGSSNTSWLILLQGGVVKDVPDADTSRITPDSQMLGQVTKDSDPLSQSTDKNGFAYTPMHDLQQGKVVKYKASSHNAAYKAVVLGRATNTAGWLIQLDATTIKMVPDSELWRLKPTDA